jgi:CDP-paratose 2-epimerase
VQHYRFKALFLLADQVEMTTSIANPCMDFEVNVFGTYNMLEAVILHTPNAALINSSTSKAYGYFEQFHIVKTN